MTDTLLDVAPEWAVDGPTVLEDVPEDVYHAGGVRTPGPQTSQSALKQLLPPSTPREFQHILLHGLPRSRSLDWGSAAHSIVLGRGADFVACPEEFLSSDGSMYRTKEGRAWTQLQRELGRIPLTPTDHAGIFAMAEEILANPHAAELLTDPGRRPEVSAYYECAEGLWMRSRFDLLSGSLADLKTSVDPHPDAWRRSAWKFGYHVQDAAYRTAFVEVTGDPDPGPMVFIVVQSKAPFVTGVYTLDREFERLGREQLAASLETYRDQYATHGDPRAAGVRWDGLPGTEAVLSPPRHAYYDAEGVEYEPEF